MPVIRQRHAQAMQPGPRVPAPSPAGLARSVQPPPPGIAFTAQQHASLADWCRAWGVRSEIELGHADCEEVIWLYGPDAARSDLALFRDGDNGDVVALLGGEELAWGKLGDVLACLACMPIDAPQEPGPA